MRRYKTMPTRELLNRSINSTMSRTVMTATTAFLSLLALVLFGGRAIEGFAQVMLTGVVICTYSAIFISSPMLIYLGVRSSTEEATVPHGKAAQAAE
jgi:preprotein translocase subunit SecF